MSVKLSETNSSPESLMFSSASTHWFSTLVIWLGFIIVVGIMLVGGGLASQLSFRDFVFAIFWGNLILAIFSFLSAYVGAHSQKSFVLLLSDAFSDSSWKLVSLYVPLILLCWFAIEASLFGHVLSSIFGSSVLLELVFTLFAVFVFSISAYRGYIGLRYVSYILVPVLLIILAFAIIFSLTSFSFSVFEQSTLSMNAAVTIVLGTWVMGSLTVLPDLTRFSYTPLKTSFACALGLFFCNSLVLLIGGLLTLTHRTADLTLALSSAGLLFPAILFAIANIWTTNDSNLYSALLHFAKLTSWRHKRVVVLFAILGFVLSLFRPYRVNFLFDFLGLLSFTSPSLGAVVLGNYLFSKRYSLKPRNSLPAWISWIGGSVVAFLLPNLIGITFSLLISVGLFYFLTKLL